MNLQSLSLIDLMALEKDLPTAIAFKKSVEAERVRGIIEKEAEKHGFQLVDIFGDGKKWKRPVSAKYRDPKSGKTWTGRGRSPKWMPRNKNDYARVAV